jgi:hypothetical protein
MRYEPLDSLNEVVSLRNIIMLMWLGTTVVGRGS